MHQLFKDTKNLSPYAKWVLISLVIYHPPGSIINKLQIIELGCPHNKFSKVVNELLSYGALSQVKVPSAIQGRPALSYRILGCNFTSLDALKADETFCEFKNSKIRAPFKLVWCFFILNQNKYSEIESCSSLDISMACGLEAIQVKKIIKKLKETNKIHQSVTGCTLKKSDTLTSGTSQSFKRPSSYRISRGTEKQNTYLIKLLRINTPLSLANYKHRHGITALILDLLTAEPESSLVFERLLYKEIRLENIKQEKLLKELEFLMVQPIQSFKYFDDILLKLTSYGMTMLLESKNASTTPISDQYAHEQIFGSPNFDPLFNEVGSITSKLICSLTNILIHYCFYNVFFNQKKDYDSYDKWIKSLNKPNKNIKIQVLSEPTKALVDGQTSLTHLILNTNLDFTEELDCSPQDVAFLKPKSIFKNSECLVLKVIPNYFAHFYDKHFLTSELN